MTKEDQINKLVEMLMKLVEYEDGRKDEAMNGLIRKDMGRRAQLFLFAKQLQEFFEKNKTL